MLDFDGILTAQAYGRAIRQTADAADAEIDRANVIIARKNDTIDALKAQMAELRAALAVEKAHSAGLAAQVKVARVAFSKGDGAVFLAKTGRKYGSVAQDAFHVVYENAFDAQGVKGGLKDPKKARAQAA